MIDLETIESIKSCGVYFFMGTQKIFTDETFLCEAEYARLLGKPFMIALKRGVVIPSDFDLTEGSLIKTWETEEELIEQTKTLLRGEIWEEQKPLSDHLN